MNGAPKIAANATAIRLCSGSNAGVGAGVLLGQGSDSVVRLQAAANRAASKHFDDSRNRGKAGRPMRLSPRYTVDHTRMRTFGEMQGLRSGAGQDLHPFRRGTSDRTELCFFLGSSSRSPLGTPTTRRHSTATSRSVSHQAAGGTRSGRQQPAQLDVVVKAFELVLESARRCADENDWLRSPNETNTAEIAAP